MAIRKKISDESQKRFWDKVKKTKTCWIWTAALNDAGYGIFGIGKETDKAHRIAWRLIRGEIPDKLFCCHICDNRKCVNPNHLFLGTNKDNIEDMFIKGRNSMPPKMGGWNKKYISDEYKKLLGKMPDTEIGKLCGENKHLIQRIRKELNIKAFPCSTRFKKGDPHPRWSRKGG